MELYSAFNEHVKPIKIKVNKEELHKIAVNRYKKVDTHPVGRKMKGR